MTLSTAGSPVADRSLLPSALGLIGVLLLACQVPSQSHTPKQVGSGAGHSHVELHVAATDMYLQQTMYQTVQAGVSTLAMQILGNAETLANEMVQARPVSTLRTEAGIQILQHHITDSILSVVVTAAKAGTYGVQVQYPLKSPPEFSYRIEIDGSHARCQPSMLIAHLADSDLVISSIVIGSQPPIDGNFIVAAGMTQLALPTFFMSVAERMSADFSHASIESASVTRTLKLQPLAPTGQADASLHWPPGTADIALARAINPPITIATSHIFSEGSQAVSIAQQNIPGLTATRVEEDLQTLNAGAKTIAQIRILLANNTNEFVKIAVIDRAHRGTDWALPYVSHPVTKLSSQTFEFVAPVAAHSSTSIVYRITYRDSVLGIAPS
jgi:hypothetical protein